MAVINLRTKARSAQGRRHLLLTAAVGVIASAGVLAGCGTATSPNAGGAGTAGSRAPAAKATLKIKVTDEATGTVKHWTLRCDPPGGTTPDAAAVCKTLFGTKYALDPLKRHVMCPMIMVSGRQIIVDGTSFGKKVHRTIIDGECDLSIFNSLAKIFR